MSLTARDGQLLRFVQDRVRTTGRTPTFSAMRLRLGLKSEEHAKQAFTNLVEHLTQIHIGSPVPAATISVIR